MRTVLMIVIAATLTACIPAPYEANPVSAVQWQRRQEAIEARELDRQSFCRGADKQSQAYRDRCNTRSGVN